MANAIAQSRNPVITNLQTYLYLKSVREETALINGKIIYDGREWTKQEYKSAFKEPTLEYDTVHLDSKQISK